MLNDIDSWKLNIDITNYINDLHFTENSDIDKLIQDSTATVLHLAHVNRSIKKRKKSAYCWTTEPEVNRNCSRIKETLS